MYSICMQVSNVLCSTHCTAQHCTALCYDTLAEQLPECRVEWRRAEQSRVYREYIGSI